MKVKIKKIDGRKFMVPERRYGYSISKSSAEAEYSRLEYFGLLRTVKTRTFPNPDIREIVYRDDKGYICNTRTERDGKIHNEKIKRLTERESMCYLPEEERKGKLADFWPNEFRERASELRDRLLNPSTTHGD